MAISQTLILEHIERLKYTKRVQEEALASTTEQLENWEKIAAGDKEPLLKMRIEILNLSNRLYNALHASGIERIGQLTILTETAAKAIPDVGAASVGTLRSALKSIGLEFAEPFRVRVEKKAPAKPNVDQLKKMSIETVGLQGWVQTDLINAGLVTIELVIAETRQELMKKTKIGAAGCNHVEYKLGQMGFRLAK